MDCADDELAQAASRLPIAESFPPSDSDSRVRCPEKPKLYYSSYESIDLKNDPFVLSRTPLQQIILNHPHKRLPVTSPPASGKSSLIELIVQETEEKSLLVGHSSDSQGTDAFLLHTSL